MIQLGRDHIEDCCLAGAGIPRHRDKVLTLFQRSDNGVECKPSRYADRLEKPAYGAVAVCRFGHFYFP